jgi:hypothetical protein
MVVLETKREGRAIEFIKRVYESYLRITWDFSEFLAQNPSLQDEWLRLGYRLVEVKSRIGKTHEVIQEPIDAILEEASETSGTSEVESHKFVDSYQNPPKGEETLSLRGVEVIPPSSIIHDGEGKVESTLHENSSGDVEARPEIRPLIDVETSESCGYCPIFRDIGTMVCPNCGRPLNLKIVQ